MGPGHPRDLQERDERRSWLLALPGQSEWLDLRHHEPHDRGSRVLQVPDRPGRLDHRHRGGPRPVHGHHRAQLAEPLHVRGDGPDQSVRRADAAGQGPDAQIQSVLENQIKAGVLPAPAGNGLATIYVVLFPPGDNVCFDSAAAAPIDDGGFCAYHGSFKMSGSSTQVLYAPIVDNGPGTPNYGGCGGNATDLGNETSVVSHELSETINDPLNQVASWYDYNYNGEIADKCDAQPLAKNGPWTVEPLWSDKDKALRGRRVGVPRPHGELPGLLHRDRWTAGLLQRRELERSGGRQRLGDRTSRPAGASRSPRESSPIAGTGATAASDDERRANANHTFAQSGNYQVSLTVTDALGFTSTKTQQISVSGGSPGTPVVNTAARRAVSDQGATLNGTINPEGQTVTYHFAYGTAPGSLTQSTSETTGPTGNAPMPVSASLSGLSASTKYYYELVVSPVVHTYNGGVQNFTTTSSAPPPPEPVVATGAAQTISASGARLTGTINPDGLTVSYYFRYGTTSLSQTTRVTSGLSGSTPSPSTPR